MLGRCRRMLGLFRHWCDGSRWRRSMIKDFLVDAGACRIMDVVCTPWWALGARGRRCMQLCGGICGYLFAGSVSDGGDTAAMHAAALTAVRRGGVCLCGRVVASVAMQRAALWCALNDARRAGSLLRNVMWQEGRIAPLADCSDLNWGLWLEAGLGVGCRVRVRSMLGPRARVRVKNTEKGWENAV